ncbi:glycosyltransferase [Candidatus Peregrinibacteria bacterium]|nr:glycosyltransferase [Candidatus Peregrinibacteria bacterium]
MNREDISKLPPDLYSRNTTIAFMAQHLLPEQKLRVLDVGGHLGNLAAFFPEETRFTILDKKAQPDGEQIEYIQGDANKIPFSDKSFDIVVGSDLIEHVEKPFRAPVIREMVRVSKGYVILGMPCKNELVERAEQYISDQFKRITNTEHPFLKEHSENGLPEEEKIVSILRKEDLDYTIIKEGNLMNWYIQQLYSVIQHGQNMEHEKYEFYQFFNNHLRELGNLRAPTYRTIFVIATEGMPLEEGVLNELQDQNQWKPERFMELLQKAFNDLKKVMVEKEASSSANSEAIQQKDQIIQEKDQKLEKAREIVSTYKTTLRDVRDYLQEKEKTVNFLKSIVAEKDETLEQLENLKTRQQEELEKLKDLQSKNEEEIQNLKKYGLKLEENLAGKDQKINALNTDLTATRQNLQNHQKELQSVINSRAWKLIMFYSKIKTTLWTKPVSLIKKGWNVLTHLGPKVFWKRLVRKMKKQKPMEEKAAYQKYVEENQLTDQDQKKAEAEIKKFQKSPVISIVMPTYNVDEKWLHKAIKSVQDQWYDQWELCICDDASTEENLIQIIKEYVQNDDRIKAVFRKKNGGIVKASNDAIELATGEFIGFLDNDDELTPDALYEVVKTLQEKDYDFIYSDEDKLDLDGNRCDPFFKPDWAPDLLLSENYTSHFSVYRRSLIEELGRLTDESSGCQDYDLVLRITEKTDKIKHIPKILYHWRKIPGSTAATVDAKPYVFTRAKETLLRAMKRRGIEGTVEDGRFSSSFRVKRRILGEPLVSIIIPFKDKADVLKVCIESILKKSTWENYEIILVDNQSEELETKEYLDQLKYNKKIKLLSYDHPFNFAAINNFAVQEAQGEYFLLLNNDTEVISEDWIQSMLEHAQREEVGAVGAKLIYPNDLIQHAGVIIGLNGIANHAFGKTHRNDLAYFGQAEVIRNYSAVTGACMMIKKDIYQKMGGLNEKDLAITFNDIDFCLRLREQGYLVVYTPFAELYHHESLSRGYEVAMKEIQYMQRKYAGILENGDPYYNRNLTQERFDFSLRVEDKIDD